MSYVFDYRDARSYEKWVTGEKNRRVLELEFRAMLDLLRPGCGHSLLDIGCGSGLSLVPFLNKGIELTGIDPSPYMLDFAGQRLGSRADLHRGHAEDLPFADNSFHYAVLFLSLEFCDDPRKALEEACRVAKKRVFVGILNRFSLYCLRYRIQRIVRVSVYDRARFFSIGEVRRMFHDLLGTVPLKWRTVLHFPGLPPEFMERLESSLPFRYSPFGGFAGIVADPVARFRAIPLALKVKVNHAVHAGEQVASCAGDYKNEQIKN